MKKFYSLLLVVAAISFNVNAQTDVTKKDQTDQINDNDIEYFFGINTGLDFNSNAYPLFKNANYGYTYNGISPRFNIGADFSVKISKRFRPRFEFRYVNVQYSMDWSNLGFDFGNSTVVNLNYLDYNLHLDYLLFSVKKLQFFVSPGLKLETLSGYTLSSNTYYFTELKQPSSIAGASLEAILKYKVSKHVGITLTPDYTIFAHSFSTGNDKSYSRFGTNIGVEFKFGE